jgi:hypothetical protein
MSTEKPKRLYKYRSPSIQDITALSNGKLWFSSPDRFNDPFDCAYDVTLPEISRADCIALIERISDGQFGEIALARFSDDELKRQVRSGLEKAAALALKRVGGVCCVSSIATDLLSWSHYAAGHRGFCLEFDTATDPLFQKVMQVRYEDALPTLSVDMYKSGDYSQGLDLLLTKTKCWEYEKEWRVLHANAELLFGYERSSLTGVYFGAKMAEEQMHMIAVLLGKTDTKLYRMHRSKARFELVCEGLTFQQTDFRSTPSA